MVDGTVIEAEPIIDQEEQRRKRRADRRRPSFNVDDKKVVADVLERLKADEMARSEWMEMRLTRYAKYRGWLADRTSEWMANSHIPIMMIDSQRLQDTLHNAIMAIRPTMRAKAIKRKDTEKQEHVDNLIDWQVFSEQKGEEALGHLTEKFVNDGVFTAYIPWVRETKRIHDVRVFPPLRDDVEDFQQLAEIIGQVFDDIKDFEVRDNFGYEWKITFRDDDGNEHDADIRFYFKENESVEAHIEMPIEAYNGPVIIPKSIEDVVHPWRCGNLQPPGPSNPNGAPHVFLIDYPRLDEIKRLKKEGFYDKLDDEGMKGLKAHKDNLPNADANQEPKLQKDRYEGTEAATPGTSKQTFTRIMAFDRWDINDDGLEEDVIFWVIKETETLLRARMLTEMFPASVPRRPFAEATFIPVGEDRRYGISLLELVESLSDIILTVINQAIDNGTITNTPIGTYRPGSGLKPEIMTFSPGELYPVGNPKEDINILSWGSNNQGVFFNIAALAQQYVEMTTMQGKLNFGQIPAGKASALRNVGSIMAILQQSDARPERILRRFFIGLSDIWKQIHELNQRFLPKRKEFRIIGYVKDDENPYAVIDDVDKQIRGRFDFDFQAALLNTNPEAIQQSLFALGQAMMGPLFMQEGLIDRDKLYNWGRDLYKAAKLDPERYLNRPSPQTDTPKLLAEEVITAILDGELPDVLPLEDPQEHLKKLTEFTQSEQIGLLDAGGVALLKQHMKRVGAFIQKQQQQDQQQQAAGQFNQGLAGAQGGNGAQGGGQVPTIGDNAQVGGDELLDESLPTAGGGSNPTGN